MALDFAERAADHTVNVTTTTAVILRANKARTAAWFINDSDVTIYLRFGQDAALNTGKRLNANGGAVWIDKMNLYKGDVSAIHGGAGNKVLCVCELESNYGL